ncbi:hypothetical protein [Aeromonas caviae]|uniref:hypothetical protein n=1 Tax=Aeromonas caviae TaxID=648 RepID=UPI002B47EDDF|nr:hypothetical protein [Aeromonas caviae]
MIMNTNLPNDTGDDKNFEADFSLFMRYKLQELAYLVRTYFIIKRGNEDSFRVGEKESLNMLNEIISLYKDGSSHTRVLALIDEFIGTAIVAFKNCCYDENRHIFIERLGWIGKKEYSYSRESDRAFVTFFLNILPDLAKELSRSRTVMKADNVIQHISFDIDGDLCKIIGSNIVSYHASRYENLIEENKDSLSESVLSTVQKKATELQANAKVEISEFLSVLMEKKADELSSLKSEYSNINDSYAKNIDSLIERANINEGYSEEVLKKANSLLDSAKDIHGRTNKEAMAGTFEKISRELITPLRVWAGGLVISLGVIFAVGIWFYVEGTENLTIPQLLSRVFLITPMVWFAWFSGRQYNHTSKLRQDYRYKSAVARAYHGYKSETGEENDQMHAHLLHNIVDHFSDNPVRLYDKTESSMPVEEFLKKISPDHLVEILKAAIQAKNDKDLKSK